MYKENQNYNTIVLCAALCLVASLCFPALSFAADTGTSMGLSQAMKGLTSGLTEITDYIRQDLGKSLMILACFYGVIAKFVFHAPSKYIAYPVAGGLALGIVLKIMDWTISLGSL